MHVAEDFRDAVEGLDLDALDASASTIYALRDDLSVAMHNKAWETFAEANGGEELAHGTPRGVTALSVVAPALRPFFEDLFRRVLRDHAPAEHEYLCPSPVYHRRFRMTLTPLARGVLVTNQLLIETPHPAGDDTHAPCDDTYRDERGLIVQCGHCRATRRAADRNTWDWVPAYVGRPRRDISHTLCPACYRYHYPHLAAKWVEYQRKRRTPRDDVS